MKLTLPAALLLGLAACLQATYASPQPAAPVTVVSVQSSLGGELDPTQSMSFRLMVDRPIEEGRLIGGDPAPSPDHVAARLMNALAARQWVPAEAGAQASLLIVAQYGALRDGERAVFPGDASPSAYAEPHVRLARMRLLTAGTEAEEYRRAWLNRIHRLSPAATAVHRAAADERYFLVLSAYSYPAAQQNRAQLVWRSKASQAISGTDFARALPGLIAASAQGLGADEGVAKTLPAAAGAEPAASGSVTASAAATLTPGELNPDFVAFLLNHEQSEFRGLSPLSDALLATNGL